MDQSENNLVLTIEVASLVCAVCIALSLGFLVGPWLGFLAMAVMSFTFVVVISVSYTRFLKRQAAEQEVDRS